MSLSFLPKGSVLHVGYTHKANNARLYSLYCLQQIRLGLKSKVYTFFQSSPPDPNIVYSCSFLRPYRLFLPILAPVIISYIIRNKFRNVHIHEPLLLLLLSPLPFLGVNVIYDVHEDYTSLFTKPLPIYRKLLLSAERLFANILPVKVVLATEKLSQRYRKQSIIVHNYVPHFLLPKPSVIRSISTSSEPLEVLYHGSLSKDRGLFTMINSLSLTTCRFSLTIIGNWTEHLLESCSSIPGWQYVIPKDYVPHSQLLQLLPSYDLGLQLVHNHPKLQGSHPMKVIEFLGCGVPTLVSNHDSKVETFGDSCAYVNAESPQDIAKSLDQLHRSYELRAKLQSKGLQLYQEKFQSEPEIISCIDKFYI